MRALAPLLFLTAAPVAGQVSYPPSAIDLSNIATKTELAGKADSSAIPSVCSTTPAADTLNGSLGSGSPCTPKQDNTRPTAVQSGNTTLGADCTFAITFSRSFTSSTPFVYAAVVDNSNTQMPCKIKTRSTAGATGTCNAAQNFALTLSALTAGTINIIPFGTTCSAGTPVMFVGREPTQ